MKLATMSSIATIRTSIISYRDVYLGVPAPAPNPRGFWVFGRSGAGKTFYIDDLCSRLGLSTHKPILTTSGSVFFMDGYSDQ